MILYVKGDLFQAPAEVLVNTVNIVGVMGKGIALTFKKLYPDMYQQYRILCENDDIEIGKLWLYKSSNKWVLNFPTKEHWRNPSKVEFIEKGLDKFVKIYRKLGIHSIAFPALGCGNGGLDFDNQIQPIMHDYLSNLPIDIFIYPGHSNTFVEHKHPAEMREWLRSEPASLPFSEVWYDLKVLLQQNQEFHTIVRHNTFTAIISEEPKGLSIRASRKHYSVTYEELMSFWQQLRTHGFTMRHIAPGIDREVSYLAPIFAKLDYVTPVHVADTLDRLKTSTVTGLQVLPSITKRASQPERVQLSLF